MVRLVCIWGVLLLAGCGAVTITPISTRLARPSLPRPQFTAETFWLSNNTSAPKRWMLSAAARQCGSDVETAETDLPFLGPYGLAGTWLLDFACPQAVHDAGSN